MVCMKFYTDMHKRLLQYYKSVKTFYNFVNAYTYIEKFSNVDVRINFCVDLELHNSMTVFDTIVN